MLTAAPARDDADTVTLAPGVPTLLDDVARPIPGPNPCGADVGDDSDFIALCDEVEKRNAVGGRADHAQASRFAEAVRTEGARAAAAAEAAAPGAAAAARGMDAARVVTLARMLLAERTKDLRVASHLTLGLTRRDGLQGVGDAVAAMDVLVRTYWDGLYPPIARMTRRKNDVASAVAHLSAALERATPVAADADALARAARHAEELAAFFKTRELGDLADAVRGVGAKANELGARLPKAPPPRPEPERDGRPEARGAIDRLSAGGDEPTRDAPREAPREAPNELSGASRDEPGTAAAAAELVLRAAAWHRRQDPRQPLAYRLARVQRWESLRELEQDAQGKTRLEAPPAVRRAYLRQLRETRDWQTLVVEGEASFVQHPFHCWLDLQHLLHQALDALGAEYAAARDAVGDELRRLVARRPRLRGAAFADGTRFADPATSAWIDELLATPNGATNGAPNGATNGAASGAAADDLLAEARRYVAAGDLARALALLQRPNAADGSRRDRFVRQLHAARLCTEAGQLPAARALLEALDADVEQHRLDAWDPDLALQLWSRLYDCYVGLAARTPRGGDTQQLGRDMERVFARMCRLDAGRALAAVQQEVKRPP